LAVFAVDLLVTVYKRAAGSLEVVTVDPLSITYKRSAGASKQSTTKSPITYK